MTQYRRTAFTMIEMVVVVTLAALLSAIATVKLREPYRKIQLENSLESIEFFDRQVRNHARRFGRRMQLSVDLNAGEFTAREMGSDDKAALRLLLPRTVTVERISLAASQDRHDIDRIEMTPRGRSPSYVLSLKGVDGRRYWLLITGLTGQAVRFSDAKPLQEIRQALVETSARDLSFLAN